jgi:ubiquinone/menaquinone biosynthesis C-methylase UbiE
MELHPKQRGRASLEFVAAVGGTLGPARRGIDRELAARGLTPDALAADLDERLVQVREALATSPAFAAESGVHAWMSAWHGPAAIEAFEELRPALEPALRALNAQGPVTLEPTLGENLPAYCRDVPFHGTGAWDGHDFMGFVHGEFVHRRQVARNFGGDIYAQRQAVLDELPRRDYRRVLEIGTSSGNYTVALTRAFPDAEIVGLDVSRRMLEQAQRVGNQLGARWTLYQRAAEDTGLPSGHFDLVTGYALGHEVPADTLRAILAEALRLLTPGGSLLLADVVPFAAQDRLQQWWAYHGAERGVEPYWKEFCSLDLAALATEAGFEDARYFGRGPRQFPHVLVARKPAVQA